MGCLPRGVSTQGGLSRGVSAQGGVCTVGGYMPRGCLPRDVSAQGVSARPPCEQNHRQVLKHYLAATTLWTLIKTVFNSNLCRLKI